MVMSSSEWRWWRCPGWMRKTGAWAGRVSGQMAKNDVPEELLWVSEDVLAIQIRVFGPDGGPTANARRDVAANLERPGRFTEAPADQRGGTSRAGLPGESSAILVHISQ
jgi:hypothetical protein